MALGVCELFFIWEQEVCYLTTTARFTYLFIVYVESSGYVKRSCGDLF
jgi:hypothetical protein